ncbi:MAG TPA: hypothetical protein VFE65_15455 [Pseudonocardia sp.]|jgi:hypothetical protein|nr:hypothetical protein [Pseudonocardia sp.]
MSSLPPSGPDWSHPEWERNSSESTPDRIPGTDPLIPADLRGWYQRVVGVVRRSALPLLIIQLAAGILTALTSYTVLPDLGLQPGLGASDIAPVPGPPPTSDGALSLLGVMIVLAVAVLAQGASVYVVIRDAAGRPVASEDTTRFAVERAPALLGWGMLAGLMLSVGLIGLLLPGPFAVLAVPGFYLLVVFGSALTGVVVVERRPLGRCFELVGRRFLPTAGRMSMALVAALAYGAAGNYVIHVLSDPGSINEALLQLAISVPLGVAAVAVSVVTYAELRFHEDASVSTTRLAGELDR